MLLSSLAPVHGAWAGPPSDQLQAGVDRVFKILGDPDLEGDKKLTQRRAAIIIAAREIFDFREMAKRSLGQHREQRTLAERGEFVRLFTELVQRSYVSKVDQHGAEKMILQGEKVDGGDRLQSLFTDAAAKHFGSGWVFLVAGVPDYLRAWWNVVAWGVVDDRLRTFMRRTTNANE
jgi:ABC-type transporter MlaC component